MRDAVAGNGTFSGVGERTHRNGDKTFYKFQGSTKRTAKDSGSWESISEGKGEIVGGTGKFKNIRGTITFRTVANPQGGKGFVDADVEY